MGNFFIIKSNELGELLAGDLLLGVIVALLPLGVVCRDDGRRHSVYLWHQWWWNLIAFCMPDIWEEGARPRGALDRVIGAWGS